jgi:hypothetical protein
MIVPNEPKAMRQAIDLLAELLECDPSSAKVSFHKGSEHGVLNGGIDASIRVCDIPFIVEYKRSGTVAMVAEGIRKLRAAVDVPEGPVRLLVVPFMGELGRRRCQEAGIAWIDLSGNADISAPGVRVYVEGRPNEFKRPGRPANPFAPKSSRVARVLLYNQDASFIQRELSELTDLGEDYISRIVDALEKQELLERLEDGSVRARDPGLLLDAWLESYDFQKHTVIQGHIAARSGSTLLRDIGAAFSSAGVRYAATGLGAAWMYTRFVAFRTVTLLIQEPIEHALLSNLGFRESETGSNVWLVLPKDEAVFWESRQIEEVQCAHPVQVYLDLEGHHERAKDAMAELRHLVIEDT